MVAQHRMLACKLCGFTGNPDQYCLETLYFCDFSVGSGPLPSSVSVHDTKHKCPSCLCSKHRLCARWLILFTYLILQHYTGLYAKYYLISKLSYFQLWPT